jgi:hypothetical protein
MMVVVALHPREELQGRALLGTATVTPHLAHVRAQGSSSRRRTTTGSKSKTARRGNAGRADGGRT